MFASFYFVVLVGFIPIYDSIKIQVKKFSQKSQILVDTSRRERNGWVFFEWNLLWKVFATSFLADLVAAVFLAVAVSVSSFASPVVSSLYSLEIYSAKS